VTAAAEPADITLSVGALSSVLLGGVRVTTLSRAGLVAAEPAILAAFEATFASAAAPYLSLWY
jgi:hypothetical protein